MNELERQGNEVRRSRRTENWVYVGLWVCAIAIFALDEVRERAPMSKSLLMWMISSVLPFVVLFVINNYVLIPRLLLRNRIWQYFVSAIVLLAGLWTYQYIHFFSVMDAAKPLSIPPPPHNHSLLPMPLLLIFTYAVVLLGANIAVALLFQHFDDLLERESLTKAHAETELAYLKAQINPHFYMNMLNNIHGMIEIDPEKAQSMVIDMSQLMRYMLYDSSRTRIPLSNEIDFLRNYIRIMRRRFPADRVNIRETYPVAEEMTGLEIPPLLTLVFVENAFKHGISFRHPSFVDVKMKIETDRLIFRCTNSRMPDSERSNTAGIGLRNIRQRLALIYGATMALDIKETETEYDVTLSIPL